MSREYFSLSNKQIDIRKQENITYHPVNIIAQLTNIITHYFECILFSRYRLTLLTHATNDES
jgi:hypothetical protein